MISYSCSGPTSIRIHEKSCTLKIPKTCHAPPTRKSKSFSPMFKICTSVNDILQLDRTKKATAIRPRIRRAATVLKTCPCRSLPWTLNNPNDWIRSSAVICAICQHNETASLWFCYCHIHAQRHTMTDKTRNRNLSKVLPCWSGEQEEKSTWE